MKKLYQKIPAMIGMGISAVSIIMALYAWYLLNHELYDGRGMSRSFATWIFSATFAILSIVFYLIDAGVIINSKKRKKGFSFDTAQTAMNIGSVPVFLLFGQGPDIVHIVLWNIYFLAMFIMEAISIVFILKKRPDEATVT